MSAALAGTILRAEHADDGMAGRGMAAEPDLSIAVAELRSSFMLGLLSGFAAELHVPLRLIHAKALGSGGTDTADSSTRAGIVDPWLVGRLATAPGRWVLGARLGVALPLGRPPARPDDETAERYARFGTGAFVPLGALDARLRLSGWEADAWVLGMLAPYETSDGYRAPHRVGGGAGASSGFGLRGLHFRLGVETSIETAERWDGAVPDEGNRGRTDVIAALGARWTTGAVMLGVDVRVPLWVHAVGEDLGYPLLLELRVEPRFRLWGGSAAEAQASEGGGHAHGHAHGHGHGHGHERAARTQPDPLEGAVAGLDVTDLSVDGEDVPLTPVAGKVTVFDFWASWCEPCVDLSRRLVELGRRHPGRLAVRRLRVETWDRPAARRWLSETPSLPHVRVVGEDGTPLFVRSGSPEEIAAAIEAALAESP